MGLIWASVASADLFDLSDHGGFKKIYFVPDPSARNVEVRVFVPVGEVDRNGPEGLAHYLEHLVVWSADRVHGEGLRDREMNAWTSPYWTAYWNRGPADVFETLMGNARAVFEPIELSQKFMLTERDIVEREFELRYRDNPTAVVYREAYHHLYGTHGLGRSVMGTPESIHQIEPADALAFHEARYLAQDAYMLIFGPITKEEVIAQIENHLADLPQLEPVERGFLAPIPKQPEASQSLYLPKLRRDEVLFVGQAARPPELSHRKLWFSLLLLEKVLNSAQPGGLAKPLYYDDFIVTDINVRLFLLPSRDIGFEVFFRPEDDISTPESQERVRKVLTDLVESGLPAKSVENLRSQTLESARRLGVSQASYHANIAQNSILNLGEALDMNGYLSGLDQPTAKDLNLVLKSIVESPFATTTVAHLENTQ